jgi:DNA-binding NarL/FixJ family response regulator
MEIDPARPISVLIVEDHRLVAQGLQLVLSAEPDIQVVGLATTGAEGIELARQTHPDVLLVDYRLQDATGAVVARAIGDLVPGIRILFLSMAASPAFLLDAVRAGARGYLLKSQAASELVEAVRRVAAGEMLIPASKLADLLRQQSEDGQPLGRLTARERELLSLLVEGLDNRAIADRLGIRYVTVRGHLRNLLHKLNAHSRLEAVAKASELGLIER